MKKKLLKKILKRLDEIEQRLVKFDYYPNTLPALPDYLGGPNMCGKCGMTFDGVTSYYCSVQDCPTFFVPTSITGTNANYYNTQARRDNMSSPGDKDYED